MAAATTGCAITLSDGEVLACKVLVGADGTYSKVCEVTKMAREHTPSILLVTSTTMQGKSDALLFTQVKAAMGGPQLEYLGFAVYRSASRLTSNVKAL